MFSMKQIIAPWVGAAVAYLATLGLKLTPDQTLALVTITAGVAGNLLHVLEARAGWAKAPLGTPDPSTSRQTPKALGPLLALGILAAAAGASSLSACATIRSTDEAIALGYATYTSVEDALPGAILAGTVSRAEAQAIDTKAGQARSLLDAARAAERTAPGTAGRDLAAATAILTALQSQLQPGAPPGGQP